MEINILSSYQKLDVEELKTLQFLSYLEVDNN